MVWGSNDFDFAEEGSRSGPLCILYFRLAHILERHVCG